MTCKAADVHKCHQFWNELKAENALMATLPPISERDDQLQQALLNLLQQLVDSKTHFVNEALPKCVDDIKMAWYESVQSTPEIFSIPNTDSDSIL